MLYGFIVLIASVGLIIYFDFATEASAIFKAIVSGIFVFCMACFFGWIPGGSLIGLFLLVALSIFIILYRAFQQAKSGNKD
jgi:hypothetical protein